MEKKPEVKLIPLESIENRFDVRVELDQDRVIQFAGMYENGVALPPITVVKLDEEDGKVRYAYVDGRTRSAARDYLGLKDVEAVVINGSLSDNPVELFARGLQANWGGSKPPTREDILHTIIRMLENGATQTLLMHRMDFIPKGTLRAHIANAKGKITKRKVVKSLEAIGRGVSIEESAKMTGVSLDVLRLAISGKKGKWGKGATDESSLVQANKGYISRQLRSANTGISQKMVEMFRLLEDGDLSADAVETVAKAWHDHLRRALRTTSDWQDRLNSIRDSQNRAVAAAGSQCPLPLVKP